jgi:hypothetical protein
MAAMNNEAIRIHDHVRHRALIARCRDCPRRAINNYRIFPCRFLRGFYLNIKCLRFSEDNKINVWAVLAEKYVCVLDREPSILDGAPRFSFFFFPV